MLLTACATSCGAPIPGERSTTSGSSVETALAWQHELAPPAATGQVRGRVNSIIDGDTIVVQVQSQALTIRLLGIDTPEKLGGPRPAECFGAEASAFVAELTPVGTDVLLSRDRETRDQYGRLLAWVHRPDGVFVNLAMVESGHATALFFAPNTEFKDLFQQAAWSARKNDRGFWPECGAADVVVE